MNRKGQIQKSKQKPRPIDLYFLLASTIIVLPLIFSSKILDPDLSPRLLFLGIITLALSIISISKIRKGKPQFDFIKLMIFPVFLSYLLVSVFSLTQAVNPAEGLFDIAKTLLSFALLIYAVQIFINHKNFISFLVKSVILSSLIATSIGLFQYIENLPGNSGYSLLMALYEVKGLMAHKNQFAISLFLMLPFALFGVLNFRKWWWGISLYSTLMILLNITILQTRSVWIATVAFIAGFILLWAIISLRKKSGNISGLYKKGAMVAIFLIVIISGSFFIFQKSGALKFAQYQVSSVLDINSDNNQGRLKMWGSTWQLSKENMLFGVGAGNWKISILPYHNLNYGTKYQNWRRPHNDFLWVLSEKGVFGLLFYLLSFLIIAIYCFKILYRETDKEKLLFAALMISGIGGYLIVAFFTFPLERVNHQVYLSLMMASIITIYYKNPAKPKQKANKPIFIYHALAVIVLAATVYYAGILVRSEIYVKKIFQAEEANDWNRMIFNADKAFTKFTTLDNYSIPIHNYRGLANMKLKNHKQALADFEVALGYSPTQVTILKNLAIASSITGNSKMAISYFKQSLELFPHYEAGLFNLSKVYYLKKEYQKAYITLLKCNQHKTNTDYKSFMEKLKIRIDTVAK